MQRAEECCRHDADELQGDSTRVEGASASLEHLELPARHVGRLLGGRGAPDETCFFTGVHILFLKSRPHHLSLGLAKLSGLSQTEF